MYFIAHGVLGSIKVLGICYGILDVASQLESSSKLGATFHFHLRHANSFGQLLTVRGLRSQKPVPGSLATYAPTELDSSL